MILLNGVTVCNICGKTLSVPESIRRGIGPVCMKKEFQGDEEETMDLFKPDPDEPFKLKEGQDIHLKRTPDGVSANIPHELVYHSPTGFEYGYLGSGPADLALNILYRFMDANHAFKYHQRFKEDFIAPLKQSADHVITAESIRDWIQANLVEELH